MVPLKIQTKESASTEELKKNVLTNLQILGKHPWLQTKYVPHDREALLVSYGKSFREDPAGSLARAMEGKDPSKVDIFTIKHAYPLFKDLPYKPKYCTILDPRDVFGISTLGHKRADLFNPIYPETQFLIASMTHYSVTQFLLGRGANIVGWHSACEAMNDPQVGSVVTNWVVGGSCSAMRAVSLARLMGYRTISLLGYDAITDAPEGFEAEERKKLEGFISTCSVNFASEQDKENFITRLAPGIELYASKKISAMLGQEKTNIHLLDQVKDTLGKTQYMKVLIGNSILWGTPELMAICQDIEAIFKHNTDVTYQIYSKGICGALWEIMGGAAKINPRPSQELPTLGAF